MVLSVLGFLKRNWTMGKLEIIWFYSTLRDASIVDV